MTVSLSKCVKFISHIKNMKKYKYKSVEEGMYFRADAWFLDKWFKCEFDTLKNDILQTKQQ